MAERCGFFNAMLQDDGEYDRVYLAQDFADYFASFIGNGVFPNPSTNLQVLAPTVASLSVVLSSGQAWINGYWYENGDNLQLDLSPASGTLNRVDAIVLRWSSSDRSIKVYVKEGVASLNAVPQSPQRDADAYEIVLAWVYVNRNVIQITQTNIEDKRPINSLCGYVHGVVEQISTTTLGNQLQTYIDEYMATYDARYEEFLEFIQNLKDLCNAAYQEFLDFIASLVVSSQNTHDVYKLFVEGLTDSSNEIYVGFIDWLNNYKVEAQQRVEEFLEYIEGILDDDVAANLLLEIERLKARIPTDVIGVIEHNLKEYPNCTAYETNNAMGTGAFGRVPMGGGPMKTIDAEFELRGQKSIEVKVPKAYGHLTVQSKISDRMYAFLSTQKDVETMSLIVVLNKGGSKRNEQ